MKLFKNLAKVKEITANCVSNYVFYEIEGEPWIEVRPAAECNKPYFNAVLRKQKAHRRKIQAGKIDAAMLSKNRIEDKELFPKLICTGKWGGWFEENGKEIPFTHENATDLFNQLPSHIFDDFRAYCNDLSNFEDEDIFDDDDAEEAGKN